MILGQNKGFTLIEILVVITIVSILATVIIGAVSTARYKATEAKVKLYLHEIEKSIYSMAIDTNKWPKHQFVDCVQTTGSNEVSDLNTPASGLVQNDTYPNQYTGWNGPYISTVSLDPWGHNYFLDTDYYVNSNGEPCDKNGSTTGCTVVVAIGSLGQNDDGGINDYDGDNIIKIISRNTVCN